MRQWTERMKQQNSDDIDNKTHRIPMVKFWIPPEASDKDEENQEDKGEVENPDGGISDTDSKDEPEKNDSETGNSSGDLEI